MSDMRIAACGCTFTGDGVQISGCDALQDVLTDAEVLCDALMELPRNAPAIDSCIAALRRSIDRQRACAERAE